MTQTMNNWTITTLGEVANLQKGMTITAKSARAGRVPVIAGGKKPAYFHAEANRPSKTITVSASGAYAGYVAFHGDPIWASDCVTAVPTNLQICTPEFLYYFMLSKQNEIYGLQRGSGMPHVYAKDLALLEIGVPPLDEQSRIVETLENHMSRLDKALAEMDHSDSQTLVFRRSILNAMLNPNVSNSKPGVESMPSTFPTIALEDLLDSYIGGLWGEEPGKSEVDVKVMRITELGANGASDLSTSATRALTTKQVASRKLHEGDIVLEKSGGGPKTPVGRVALIGSLTQDVICSNFMLLMRPNKSQVLSKYLHHYLTYLHVTGQTIPLQSSSTNIRNISTPDYMQIRVPVPPLDEQGRIVETLDDRLSRLDSTRKSITSQKLRLATLRRSILNKAFNGELGTN